MKYRSVFFKLIDGYLIKNESRYIIQVFLLVLSLDIIFYLLREKDIVKL